MCKAGCRYHNTNLANPTVFLVLGLHVCNPCSTAINLAKQNLTWEIKPVRQRFKDLEAEFQRYTREGVYFAHIFCTPNHPKFSVDANKDLNQYGKHGCDKHEELQAHDDAVKAAALDTRLTTKRAREEYIRAIVPPAPTKGSVNEPTFEWPPFLVSDTKYLDHWFRHYNKGHFQARFSQHQKEIVTEWMKQRHPDSPRRWNSGEDPYHTLREYARSLWRSLPANPTSTYAAPAGSYTPRDQQQRPGFISLPAPNPYVPSPNPSLDQATTQMVTQQGYQQRNPPAAYSQGYQQGYTQGTFPQGGQQVQQGNVPYAQAQGTDQYGNQFGAPSGSSGGPSGSYGGGSGSYGGQSYQGGY